MQPTPTAADFEGRLTELKEVKLKLPIRHHVSLHSLKLLRNQSISELVASALDAYFSKTAVPRAGPAGPVMGPAADGAPTSGPNA
jgi:hypothetical protein